MIARGVRVAVLAFVVLIATAPPAAAHTLAGVEATNYRSEILSVAPPAPGLSVELLDLGRRVRVTNTGGTDVVVLGYDGEPYLRVGPSGTYENTRAPALYKNRPTAEGTTTTLPASADATASPRWKRTGGGDSVTWRDHRTRWEGDDPAAVKADRDRTQVVVPAWTIQLERDGDPIAVTGRIRYEPPPPFAPWIVLAVAAAVLTAVAGATGWWGPILGAVLAVLVAVDVVQSFASGAVSGDSIPVLALKVLLGGIISTVAWVVGAIAIGPLQRGREGALVGAGVAGLFIALYSGLSDLPTLVNSQAPSALPDGIARAGVALALGLGVGLVAAIFVVVRTNPDVSLSPPASGAPPASA